MSKKFKTLLALTIILFATQSSNAQITLFGTQSNTQIDFSRAAQGIAKARQAYKVTDEQLAQVVKAQVEEMDKKAQIAPANSKYAQRLQRLTATFKQAGNLPLNFKVYITTEVNAFACPDGSVRVYSGIMDLLDDNELLGVVGHEIGHVAKKHSLKAWKDAMYRSALNDMISSSSNTYSVINSSTLGQLAESAISAKFSRKQENEADDYGYEFLKQNNQNPWGMAIAFEKMKALQGSSSSESQKMQKYLALFSSHPDFDKRIKRMSDKAQKDGFSRP